MSKRIGIGENCALAFGFTWQAIDPLESPGSQRKKLMQQGMRWEANFKVDQIEYIGASKEDFTPIKDVKTVAGAAQIANHPRLVGRTALLIMEQPVEGAPTEMAIVGLINGNIVVDDYTHVEGARKLRIEFSDKCKRSGRSFDLVGKSHTQGAVAEEFAWSDFRPNTAKGFRRKSAGTRAVLVKPLEPKISPKIIWGTVAIVALFAGYWAYTTHVDQQEQRAKRAREEALKNSGPKRYSDSITALLAKPMLSANVAFASLREGIKDFPTKRKGWVLQQVDCRANGECTASWENSHKLGDYGSFVEDAPKEWGVIVLDNTGEVASHHLPVNLPARVLPAQDGWSDQRAFLLRQFSQWQKYWILSFHPELSREPVVVGVPEGVDAKAAAEYPDAVWATTWEIKDTPWDLAEGFDRSPEKLNGNLPDSVTVEHIKIKFEKDRTVLFTAEGKVYVRK